MQGWIMSISKNLKFANVKESQNSIFIVKEKPDVNIMFLFSVFQNVVL